MEWHLMATVSIKYFANRIGINIIWQPRIIPLKSFNKMRDEEEERRRRENRRKTRSLIDHHHLQLFIVYPLPDHLIFS